MGTSTTDLAAQAACDASLAALGAQHPEHRPEDVLSAAAPWSTAVRVRAQLAAHGATTEWVAQRLLQTWTAPLDDLPAAALSSSA